MVFNNILAFTLDYNHLSRLSGNSLNNNNKLHFNENYMQNYVNDFFNARFLPLNIKIIIK